jgi:hypothetical protein
MKHHLRELKSIIEHDNEPWADEMRRLFLVALRCRHFHGDHSIPGYIQRWCGLICMVLHVFFILRFAQGYWVG